MKTIPLTQNKHAIVDDEDFGWLINYSWCYSGNGYSQGTVSGKRISMHRLIMGAPKGKVIDHINYDTLDNRRSNLRICTYSQNIVNSRPRSASGYKGVDFFKKLKKWRAKLKVDGATKHIGYFNSKEEAAKAYNEFAEKHYKDYAYLNEID